jgi:hypothetical protein
MFIADSLQIPIGCIHIYSVCTTPTCTHLARGFRNRTLCKYNLHLVTRCRSVGMSSAYFSPRQEWSKRKLSKPSGLIRSLKLHNMIQNVSREYISCCHSLFVWRYGTVTRGTSVTRWEPARLLCGSSVCFTEYKIFNSKRMQAYGAMLKCEGAVCCRLKELRHARNYWCLIRFDKRFDLWCWIQDFKTCECLCYILLTVRLCILLDIEK